MMRYFVAALCHKLSRDLPNHPAQFSDQVVDLKSLHLKPISFSPNDDAFCPSILGVQNISRHPKHSPITFTEK